MHSSKRYWSCFFLSLVNREVRLPRYLTHSLRLIHNFPKGHKRKSERSLLSRNLNSTLPVLQGAPANSTPPQHTHILSHKAQFNKKRAEKELAKSCETNLYSY